MKTHALSENSIHKNKIVVFVSAAAKALPFNCPDSFFYT
ncbi:hypothetical protein QSI_1012 [Clostridioides difficile P28]|nr:hypothetical protein QSI_1012 [Clostridioides difficile P28]